MSKTFRVFVSSTFSDLKLERDALQLRVFPRLREFCAQHGARFQPIDLRWGVSEEASRDQQTMNICLGEIERCQQITPRPNFIVLLGDRYGWRPPPPQILAQEYEAIYIICTPEEQVLLDDWYLRDDNAIPPEYVLQPWDAYRYEQWAEIERELHDTLEHRAKSAGIAPQALFKYWASATHQEIAAGALSPQAEPEHVFAFFRQIDGLPEGNQAANFRDLDQAGRPDEGARRRLDGLKAALDDALAGNVKRYITPWTANGPADDHIDRFCTDVYDTLKGVIAKQLAGMEELDPLEAEIAAHEAFGRERARFFIGRRETLARIAEYIAGTARHPLAVWGEAGSGKSTLLARAVQQVREAHPGAVLIYRFIGATPESSSGHALLRSLCSQISRHYGADESDIPLEYRDLAREFPARLGLATGERPLLLFLDALDQLSNTDNARSLIWLPDKLPLNVRMVVSSLPGQCKDILNIKLLGKGLLELKAMPDVEASHLLDLWLANAGRTLQPDQRTEVLTKFSGCPKPLYLKLAFEEVRRWSSYGGLPDGGDRIPGLSDDIIGIIRDLFARLSSDANHGKLLVSRSLGYLAAAKNGLTEDELLDVLARDLDVYAWFLRSLFHIPPDLLEHVLEVLQQERKEVVDQKAVEDWFVMMRQVENSSRLRDFLLRQNRAGRQLRLPVVLWSRLFADLQPYLTTMAADGTNLLTFYHPTTFGQAVMDSYFEGDERELRHRVLASFFQDQPLVTNQELSPMPNLRKLTEEPYQQAHGHLWKDLQITLTDFTFLQAKVRALGPKTLVDDYKEAYAAGYLERDLSLVQGTLQLSLQPLATDSNQLAGQLLGRLLAQEMPTIQSLLQQAEKWRAAPWLRPTTPSLLKPGGPLLRNLEGHTRTIRSVTVTPDGSRAISGSEDGTIRVWDLSSGLELYCIQLPRSFGFNMPPTTPVSPTVLPDGVRLVAGVNNYIFIWNLETGECLSEIHCDGFALETFLVAVNGKRAVSLDSFRKMFWVWDLEKGMLAYKSERHTERIGDIKISPDGHFAVFGTEDNTLIVWDIEHAMKLHTLLKDFAPSGFVITKDSKFVLVSPKKANMRLIDLEQGIEKVLKARIEASRFEIAPDGKYLVTSLWSRGEDCIDVWDFPIMNKRFRLVGLKGICFDPEGRVVLSTSKKSDLVVWDILSGEVRAKYKGHAGGINTMLVTPDGKRAVSGSSDKTLKVWDLEYHAPKDKTSIHTGSIKAIAALPDGQRAVSGSLDKTLKIWDIRTGTHLATLEGNHFGVYSMAVFPDGRHVALTVEAIHPIVIWNLENGQEIASYHEHASLAKVIVLPDGERFLSYSSDKTLKIWDFHSPKSLATLEGHDGQIFAGAVTQDGNRAITGSPNTIKVWDLLQMQEITTIRFTLPELAATMHSIAVLPNGDRILIGSRDGLIRMLDLKTERFHGVFRGHQDWVLSLAVSPDGKFAISGSKDNSIKVWDIQSRQVLTSFPAEGAVGAVSVLQDNKTILCGNSAGQIHFLRLEGVSET